jgi:hypothetical protein
MPNVSEPAATRPRSNRFGRGGRTTTRNLDRRYASVIAGIVCLVTLIATSAAIAAPCSAPPGTAALDQYCEVVPSAGGTGHNTSHGKAEAVSPPVQDAIDSLPASQARELAQTMDRLGPAAAKEVSPRPRAGIHGTGPGVDRGEPRVPAEPSGNPLSAAARAVTGGPTSGPVFPWVLISVWAMLAGVSWVRYRGRTR